MASKAMETARDRRKAVVTKMLDVLMKEADEGMWMTKAELKMKRKARMDVGW